MKPARSAEGGTQAACILVKILCRSFFISPSNTMLRRSAAVPSCRKIKPPSIRARIRGTASSSSMSKRSGNSTDKREVDFFSHSSPESICMIRPSTRLGRRISGRGGDPRADLIASSAASNSFPSNEESRDVMAYRRPSETLLTSVLLVASIPLGLASTRGGVYAIAGPSLAIGSPCDERAVGLAGSSRTRGVKTHETVVVVGADESEQSLSSALSTPLASTGILSSPLLDPSASRAPCKHKDGTRRA
mmetsp:Transcript_70608/g.140108  ORF Transcript_70608/g.140108 Transcript_70608/m.140108 type:complete len:248 (+) Transcript_70608:716-1459(+)